MKQNPEWKECDYLKKNKFIIYKEIKPWAQKQLLIKQLSIYVTKQKLDQQKNEYFKK